MLPVYADVVFGGFPLAPAIAVFAAGIAVVLLAEWAVRKLRGRKK